MDNIFPLYRSVLGAFVEIASHPITCLSDGLLIHMLSDSVF